MNICTFLTSFVIGWLALVVRADEPLSLPKRHDVESQSKKYIATVDPKKGVTVRAVGVRKPIWAAPEIWSRRVLLADDGEHLVTGYDGLNLIPVDYTTNLVLITFWHRDQKIREVTVGDLFPDTKALRRTVWHYNWGGIVGIQEGKLIVRRCDKKEVRFEISSGKETN
jgi:hypothetical protein